VQDLGLASQTGPAGQQRDQLARVRSADPVPVERAPGQVRHRGEDGHELTPAGGERRIRGRGARHQQGRVPHQPALSGELAEGRPPGAAEQQVVVCGSARCTGHAEVHDDRRRRGHQRACDVAEQPVGGGQLTGQDDGVAGKPLAVGRTDGGDASATAFERRHGHTVAERDAGVRGGAGEGVGQCSHPAAREVHPADGVHVGDHRVQRQRTPGGEPRVQGLEGEDPPQPVVTQEPADRAVPAAEPAERRQAGQPRGQQAEWRVDVGRDELCVLGLVQPGQPVAQPCVPGRLTRPGERPDRLDHGVALGPYVEGRAVGEVRPVGRVQPDQRQPVGQ